MRRATAERSKSRRGKEKKSTFLLQHSAAFPRACRASSCARVVNLRIVALQERFRPALASCAACYINLLGTLRRFCQDRHLVWQHFRKPPRHRQRVRRPTGLVSNHPTASSVIRGACPGRIPRYPLNPGICASSATSLHHQLRGRDDSSWKVLVIGR